MADQSAAVTREDALAFADEAFRNRDITFSHRDVADMTGALSTFLQRHRLGATAIASTEQSAATPWFAWPARKTWEEVRVRLRSRDGNEWEEIASDFEYWMQSADGEMCDDVVAFQIIGETPLGLASVSSASAADFSLNPLEDQLFMATWSEMGAKGFAYGDEELESVHLGWLMARGTLAASPEPVPASHQAGEVRTEWRCFHCGDAFTDERCARLHFGRDEDSAPACQIKAGAEQGLLGALRDAEYAAADAMRAIADECTDAAKAYYSQMTRHNQALRNAEELGYERGLADARALATQPATSQEGEAQVRAAAQFLSDRLDNLEWMDDDLEATLRDYMGHVDPAHTRLRSALAATPTPPTLSEDLRVFAEQCAQRDDSIGDDARAALAQVKAS